MSDQKSTAKKLGLLGCVSTGVGAIVGSGIFGSLPTVINDIGPGVILALIGAVMAAGSVTDGKGTSRTARSILTSFQEKSGATICKDLKGVETGKVLCPCAQCVRNAVLAAGEMLGE